MNTREKIVTLVSSILIVVLLVWKIGTLRYGESNQYPNQPIQVVVPYAAGGGTDTFVRIFQKSISAQEVLSQPVVVLNQPGGGGTIGSRFVMGSRPDGYRILCHNESIITSELSGTANFGPDDFAPIAQTGAITLLILARADSPYDDLLSMMEEAKRRPNELRFGADVGSPAYFNAMQLEKVSEGSKFNYISTGGGQKRFTQILGGHLEAGIFSLSEYISFRLPDGANPAENVKAIAVLTAERNPAIPEVKTAMEQGLEIDTSNAFYWWAPKDTPPEVVSALASVLENTMQDAAVIKELNKLSVGLVFRKGDQLMSYLESRKQAMSAFAVETPSELPNFPMWALGIVTALLVWVLVDSKKARTDVESLGSESSNARMALTVVAILSAYIISLQFGVAYALATAPALFLIAGTIAEWRRERLAFIVQLALLFTLGSEYVFTSIFSVPLP